MKATIQRVTSLFGVPRASVFVPRISTPFILHNYISNGRMVLFSKEFYNGRVSKSDLWSSNKEEELLVSQRKKRPISPHLTVYEPEMSWYLSSLHRISGVLLALGFYAFTNYFGCDDNNGNGYDFSGSKQVVSTKRCLSGPNGWPKALQHICLHSILVTVQGISSGIWATN